MIDINGFHISLGAVVLGMIIGATYGILAVGMVLIYRVNRVVNFAQGEIGGFGASVMLVAMSAGVPYWLGVVTALGVGGAVGGLAEVGVIRRLRNAPRLMSVIATLGFAQLLSILSVAVTAQSRSGSLFPDPPGLPQVRLQPGNFLITHAHFGILLVIPVVVVLLILFLRFSRYGVALRASAANPDAARLDGIFAARMSTMAWVIAGMISALTAVLVLPTTLVVGATFGPALVVRGLAAAVLARMNNLAVAFLGGIGVGVVEQVILSNTHSGGQVELALFVIILVTLLFLQPRGGRLREKTSAWASITSWKPLPEAYKRIFVIRHAAVIVAAIALAGAIGLPSLIGYGDSFAVTEIFAFAIVGLSVGVITGLAGQLSLGQFALAAIGASVAIQVAHATNNYLLGIVAGGVAGAVASVVVGIPALRIKGLMLAVTTLSLAIMTETWLLQQPWMLGIGTEPGHPFIGTFVFDDAKSYYFLALAFLVVALWLTRNLRNGGMGRILVAIRDNEDAARAFSIAATGRKLQAFAVSGALAGLGGAVFAFGITRISFDAFHSQSSITIVAMAVIGGIGLLVGPLLGALYMIGLPAFVPLDNAGLTAQAAGWLLLILYVPGGLAALILPLRNRAAAAIARRLGVVAEEPAVEAIEPDALPTLRRLTPSTVAPVSANGAGPLLQATDLVKRYGGVAAVDGASVDVHEGETLGLIGPNGAGKTTLFELLSGFSKPDSGRVVFAGNTVNWTLSLAGPIRYQVAASPERRARLGLVRSFQDSALFPTMSVQEVVMLALERAHPTTLVASMVGSIESERPKRAKGLELIDMMGLGPHRNKAIAELSTGMRRITELTCMIAQAPKLLLLDEPSSGIAQRETEALGEVLTRVKAHLGATLVVIEHDIPLIMSLADRIVAMESGRIIAEGSPQAIRENELVIESYLGRSLEAIERSGAVRAEALAPA